MNKINLIDRLKEYINDELQDSLYYEALSKKAPNEMQKILLLEFAQDEKEHANTFAKIINCMSKCYYGLPKIRIPNIPEDYVEALQKRVINESADYRKYGNEYLMATTHTLKDAFYRAKADENVHAIRILDMISQTNKLYTLY